MGSVAHGLRRFVELLLWPFDRLPPLLGLTLVSILTGIVLLWVVGKTTPQRLVERARAKMAAAIYEIRIFLDSPRRVFGAQGRLLGWSFAYVGAMLPALLIISLPLGLLYLHLEVRYGLAPLETGEPTVVRVDLAEGVDGYQLRAEGSGGARVTAPPLYDEERQRLYLRVVLDEPKTAKLTLETGDRVIDKELRAGAGRASPSRAGGAALFLAETDEPPLSSADPARAISVRHPALDRSWAYLPWWWLYWLLVATIAALALRRRFGVEL